LSGQKARGYGSSGYAVFLGPLLMLSRCTIRLTQVSTAAEGRAFPPGNFSRAYHMRMINTSASHAHTTLRSYSVPSLDTFSPLLSSPYIAPTTLFSLLMEYLCERIGELGHSDILPHGFWYTTSGKSKISYHNLFVVKST